MDSVITGSAAYKNLFVGQQPYKSLYTLYSFCKCIRNDVQRRASSEYQEHGADLFASNNATFGITMRLVTQTLNDKNLMAETPEGLQPQLMNTQLDTLETLLKGKKDIQFVKASS